MNSKAVWVIGLSSLLLAACGSLEERPEDVPVEERSIGRDDGRGGVETGSAQLGGEFGASPLTDPASPLAKRVIYFAFDSSEVTPEGRELIATHARYLAQNPEISVVLEGHADERGSREYNLALGERRAKAVERLMTLQGVGARQVQVISFGEERPVAFGHDESAWRLNRRVELLYSGY
ncbi:peptidoglycan-associated lipoprotein Pal [Sulfurivermis fontis]|jgi:peptidoglycan-associated lipoprotein|uniref:peptidoglycan-associated lipoprotein Pal n=1 Tax=Sulfurivermis fontis TaxID=1972068 RepID=UPI000FDC7C4A|nr:peptidoglycan-associated lipoprotein Pal [Sulfurivermis fontis]